MLSSRVCKMVWLELGSSQLKGSVLFFSRSKFIRLPLPLYLRSAHSQLSRVHAFWVVWLSFKNLSLFNFPSGAVASARRLHTHTHTHTTRRTHHTSDTHVTSPPSKLSRTHAHKRCISRASSSPPRDHNNFCAAREENLRFFFLSPPTAPQLVSWEWRKKATEERGLEGGEQTDTPRTNGRVYRLIDTQHIRYFIGGCEVGP